MEYSSAARIGLLLAGVVVAALPLAASLWAQDRRTGNNSPVEVASVKENRSGTTAAGGLPSGPGRFGAINMTLRLLISAAYGGIPTSRIFGGPDWADTVRFDVVGIGDPSQSQMNLLQAVLRDRFALRVRRESRQFDIYSLVVARPNAPGLRRSSDCSTAEAREKRQAANDKGDSFCGVRQRPGQITARGVRLTNVVGYLGAGRPVFDRTELKDYFDIDLEWAPTPTDDGPSIFTAVQEQLGLKLEAAQGPLDVIVIESVERPTPD